MPGILSENTVLYAPSIEWWMNNIEIVNIHMETSIKGLYVCGDGSGWSQGIVHSAATGILAAEGITGTELNNDMLLNKLLPSNDAIGAMALHSIRNYNPDD